MENKVILAELASKTKKLSFEGVEIDVIQSEKFEFVMDTKTVALGYGISEEGIRSIKSRHFDELIEGKHFISCVAICNGDENQPTTKMNFWTKRGVARLGFFVKSERAKKFRDWAEDLIIEKSDNKLPKTYIEALEALLVSEKSKVLLESKVEALTPKAEYCNDVLQSEGLIPITIIAKELGMSAIELSKLLHINNIVYKIAGVWVLYEKYQHKGYTKTKTFTFLDKNENKQSAIHTYWTELGREFLHRIVPTILQTKKMIEA